jgi:hypothetical protein
MRCVLALILSAVVVASLPAAPPAPVGEAGPRGILSTAQAIQLRDQTPLTKRGITKLVGPPSKALRPANQPDLTVWFYSAPTGKIALIFHRDRLCHESFPPLERPAR